jgi:peptidoglycan hydrolase-like protein with peptidoglycan-binding domain
MMTRIKNLRLIWPLLLALILSVLPNLANPSLGQSAPPGPRSLLKIGSQGESVIELQAVLLLMGYYTGKVDGIYDENTAQAVRKFQQDAGISVDGMAGTDTWNRLFPPSPIVAQPSVIAPQATTVVAPATTNINPQTTPTTSPIVNSLPGQTASGDWQILRVGMEGSAVLGLQQRLTALGFYSGPINGVFDSKTEAAVKAAQQKFNLPADGTVGPATWNALMQ